MKAALTLLCVTLVVTITTSVPISRNWNTKPRLHRQKIEPLQQDLTDVIAWLQDIASRHKIAQAQYQLKPKRNFAHTIADTIFSKDEIIKNLQNISDVFVPIIKIIADYNYKLHKKEFGIDDELNKKLRRFTDLLLGLYNSPNKLERCQHTDDFTANVTAYTNTLVDILEYLEKKAYKWGNITTDGCPKVSNRVDTTLDSYTTIYAWMKKRQARIACSFFIRMGKNLTDKEKDAYKEYFDVVITLYENMNLTEEADRAAFQRAMNFLLQKINSTKLPPAAKRAIAELTHTCMKIILGEKLNLLDKYYIVKNVAILLMGHLRGNTRDLLMDQPVTLQMGTSLIPIVMNIYLSAGFAICRERSTPVEEGGTDFKPSKMLRKIYTHAIPVFRNIVSNLKDFLSKNLNSTPVIVEKMPHTQSSHRKYMEFPSTLLDNAGATNPITKNAAKTFSTKMVSPASPLKEINHINLWEIILQ